MMVWLFVVVFRWEEGDGKRVWIEQEGEDDERMIYINLHR